MDSVYRQNNLYEKRITCRPDYFWNKTGIMGWQVEDPKFVGSGYTVHIVCLNSNKRLFPKSF